MGIKSLSKVIADHAPGGVKLNEIKNLFGRKVAIDASMSIYQFLIAVRSQDGTQLQNEDGETTSHLMGIFYRTIRMVENGIKPVYVFDGKPPSMKSDELAKRGVKRAEANQSMENAVEQGDQENISKFSKRTVKVTRKHNEECQELLKLMGIPWVQAPCEAEAQCAALAKAGLVYGVGSEDMDTLTFAAPVLLRHLTFSEAKKMPIKELHFAKILEGLELSYDQFIDMCILLGCDYCDSIRGVGPHKAFQLIKDYSTIEKVLENLDVKKYPVPQDWPFEQARKLFKNPDVTDPENVNLKWIAPDEQGIIDYLVRDRGFNEERIRKSCQKLRKLKSTSTQGRIDGFFKVVSNPDSPVTKKKVESKKVVKSVAKKVKRK